MNSDNTNQEVPNKPTVWVSLLLCSEGPEAYATVWTTRQAAIDAVLADWAEEDRSIIEDEIAYPNSILGEQPWSVGRTASGWLVSEEEGGRWFARQIDTWDEITIEAAPVN